MSLNKPRKASYPNQKVFLCFPFFFWPCCVAHRILVPRLVIEPKSPAVEVQSLYHWTIREIPESIS